MISEGSCDTGVMMPKISFAITEINYILIKIYWNRKQLFKL